MWCHVVLVIASWLATKTQAYAPILWTKLPAKMLVITPRGFSGNLKDLPTPQQLTLMDPPEIMSPKTTPYFTIEPDKTIIVDTGLCIEAGGDKSGDGVRINKCTGRPSQKWNWIPNGHGQNMIQLMDTNKCLDVKDEGASADGATIQLQECKSRVMDAWKFEEPIPTPTRDASQSSDFSEMRHAMITLIALAGIGSLALHRRFWRQRDQRTVVPSADEGSVCLTVPLSNIGNTATPGARNAVVGGAHISMSSVDSSARNKIARRAHVSMSSVDTDRVEYTDVDGDKIAFQIENENLIKYVNGRKKVGKSGTSGVVTSLNYDVKTKQVSDQYNWGSRGVPKASLRKIKELADTVGVPNNLPEASWFVKLWSGKKDRDARGGSGLKVEDQGDAEDEASSSASTGEPKRVYSIADQVRRFERAKEEKNERYLNISSVYSSKNMKGKKVLVIGASKGLGLELIKQLVEDGAEPIATCRRRSAELREAGASQIISNVEVTSTRSLERMARSIEGPLDYVIFNAGIFPNVVDNLDSIQPQEAMNQFNVCGFGPVRCMSVLKGAGLLKGAKVAVISSQAGSAEWRFTQNKDKGGDYGHHMCRAATNMACTLMSEELKDEKVPIVILHPGFNRTSMTEKYSEIWDIEGAVPPGDGAKRVLYETALISMETSGQFINCEDGLRIPW